MRVTESQKALVEAQRSARDVDGMIRRADNDLMRANALLGRKRDAVRRELRRRAVNSDNIFDIAGDGRVRLRERRGDDEDPSTTIDDGSSSVFYTADDGRVRLNPRLDYRHRSSMDAMGFEKRTMEAIVALRDEEARIKGEYDRLMEMAGRLASRSERLILRSEELIGKRRLRQQQVD